MPQAKTEDAPSIIRRICDEVGFDESIAGLAEQVFTHAVDAGAIEEGVERANDGTFEGNDTRFPPAVYPAAVLTAARVRDIPTKAEFVAGGFVEDHDDVTNHYKQIVSAIPFEVEPESVADWVRRICGDLAVPDGFVDDAVELAGDAVDAGLHIGKSTSGFAAAVVFATATNRPEDVEQAAVAKAASVSPTTIRNQYRDVLALRDGSVEPGDPDAIEAGVNSICDRIDGLPGRVRADALELADRVSDVDDEWVTKTNPKGVAAGVVYVVAKDVRVDVSQEEVASVASVSKSTVVNRVNDFRDWRRRDAFDGVNYNRLKRLAAEHDVAVGNTPERDYLVDRLVESGVEP